MKLKVCGLTRIEQIHELISMDTDFLGFIFYEKSPRYVLNHLSLEEISKFSHTGKFGVFVNEGAEKIVTAAEKSGLNYIQLHGDENAAFISELRKKLNPETRIIKAVRIGADSTIPNLERLFTSIHNDIDYLLFDTDSRSFGGTGKQFDWNVLNEFDIPLPYFLSGGISEDNIDNVKMLAQKPFALDINSKFETAPGNKDLEKIKHFKSKIK
ncbi:phosphoribosylanthranilate isomerase [Chryseobacterium sp. H1D6B]|uniref:phosphoribosylanthranilate isomerase n=1 Tax=Chryseobacterium sp. H1D6B TaxID=2940588 RepID=UPI0015C7A9FB|nr:phosphoribosylanthranilate isomerase [Chryseobacterium sp. H1D6B]MDH6253175.1 phosphoribosylanthranilate isomerase [Chryseobacterium sp. H1D6B]